METFSALLAICAGNPPVTGGLPSQRPVTRSFDVFFFLSAPGQNGWANNRAVDDMKRHRAHYDVTVMLATPVRLNGNQATVLKIFLVHQRFQVTFYRSDVNFQDTQNNLKLIEDTQDICSLVRSKPY